MRRSLVVSLLISVLVAVVALAATLAAGWHPKLGLDLAGGSEVVYQPHSTHRITQGDINTTIDIIRNRVDATGVSGATVTSQGGNIVVQLPGLKNPQAVIDLIGKTAQLQFRPVLCAAGPYVAPSPPPPSPPPVPSSCPSGSQYSLQAPNLQVTPSPSAQGGYTTNLNSIPPDPKLSSIPSTTNVEDDNNPNGYVLVPVAGTGGKQRYLLGPSQLSGTAVKSAQALIPPNQTQWVVDVTLTSAGAAKWDQVAQQNFHQLIGIDLDGVVESAPITQPQSTTFSSFQGQVQISGNFTEASAKNLALVLNYGALPVQLGNPISNETVTPTLGKSSLRAGLAAGIGGLLLVLLYTILYYRALGVVVLAGLATTAALLWAVVSALGHSGMNLTLDLAGVTGLIVSVGITVDSYIVYFERLKDEARAGRSIRTSVDRSFKGAFRTVLAADLVSLAAAVVLYLVAVGSVRGFAFFLGLSTLLDIVMTFFFTRPLVILLGRSRAVTDAPVIGVARGLAIDSGSQP